MEQGAGLQLQHSSVLSAVGASLGVGWFLVSFLRGFDGQQVGVELVTAGLQVCREPLVGVVDDVWCLSSPGPEGDVWACRGEWAGGIVELVTGVSVMLDCGPGLHLLGTLQKYGLRLCVGEVHHTGVGGRCGGGGPGVHWGAQNSHGKFQH